MNRDSETNFALGGGAGGFGAQRETAAWSEPIAAPRPAAERQQALCAARISVGEYARALGLRDPEQIARFARHCVRRATRRALPDAPAAELVAGSLDAAAWTVGVGGRTLPPAAEPTTPWPSGSAAGTRRRDPARALVEDLRFVPTPKPRTMPRQPLAGDQWRGAAPWRGMRWLWRAVRAPFHAHDAAAEAHPS